MNHINIILLCLGNCLLFYLELKWKKNKFCHKASESWCYFNIGASFSLMPCRHILLRHQHVAALFHKQRLAEPMQQYGSGKAQLLHPRTVRKEAGSGTSCPWFKPLSPLDPCKTTEPEACRKANFPFSSHPVHFVQFSFSKHTSWLHRSKERNTRCL